MIKKFLATVLISSWFVFGLYALYTTLEWEQYINDVYGWNYW